MASFNKVILMGNLTRDPDVRSTPGGMTVCTLGLAINRRYTTASGQDREEVCFVDIDVFGKQAESCRNYLRKGAPALVEGSLHMDQWEDKATGKKRSRLLVRADRVQFLSSPGRDTRSYSDEEVPAEPTPRNPAPPAAPQPPAAPRGDFGGTRPPAPAEPDTDAEPAAPPMDDIPF
ncbi:MAG: single-stranded DNA-binding protein [Lentisphaeria bacterium]|jgi:single-strand DNA-binding protein